MEEEISDKINRGLEGVRKPSHLSENANEDKSDLSNLFKGIYTSLFSYEDIP